MTDDDDLVTVCSGVEASAGDASDAAGVNDGGFCEECGDKVSAMRWAHRHTCVRCTFAPVDLVRRRG